MPSAMPSLQAPAWARPALGLVLLVLAPACSYMDTTRSGPPAPSGLAYQIQNPTYAVGLAITPNPPTCSGQVDAYAVVPALPAGLVLDPATGVLSGTPSTLAGATGYQVTARNAHGQTSTTLTLAIVAQPSITSQPADQSIGIGQNATFQVGASDPLPLTYQWRRNGTPIAGAVAASYTLTGAALADDGALFSVAVSNPGGTITSSSASLAVAPAPTITSQPASQITTVGGGSGFTVAATGYAPLAIQWLRDGSPVAGATGTSFAFIGAALADSGTGFSALVTDGHGLATLSATAVLTVAAPPAFTRQPTAQTATQGLGATFTASAEGTGAIAYQWLRNGNPIGGAQSSTYTLPVAGYPDDDGATFQVRASDPYGGVATSASAALTVLPSGTRVTAWVSGVGSDANPGLRTMPVASLAQAQGLLPAGGGIGFLDPGRFTGFTIDRTLVLDAAQSPGLLAASAGGGLVVDAPATATVILRNLEINAAGADSAPAAAGVTFRGAGLLVLEHCTIHGFTDAGVDAALAGGGRLVLRDVHIIGGTVGVRLAGSGLEADLTGCCVEGAQTGLDIQGGTAHLDRLLVAQNAQVGVQASGGAVSVERCTLAGNGTAVQALAGTVRLADNDLFDNAAAFAATGGSLVSAGSNRLAGSPAGSATLAPLTLQ